MARAPISRVDLGPRHLVETPESVTLGYEAARIGSRSLAAAVDHAILIAGLIGLSALRVIPLGSLATAGLIALSTAVALGYFIGFESWWQGQTPGKRLVGIRVVRITGHPAGFGPVVIRNIVRMADFFPPPYVTGFLFLFFHPRARRLGDLAAGTLVVRDRPIDVPHRPHIPVGTATAPTGLEPAEYAWLESYLERADDLDPAAGARIRTALAARFTARWPDRPADDATFLRGLYDAERAARASGGGDAEERTAFQLAERQGPRWEAFDAMARAANTRGLDTFSAPDLIDFAARYREVSSDLARARTYSAPELSLDRLERLVTAGHNALYREPPRSLTRLVELAWRRCPAAVVTAWRTVLLALVLLFVPAAVGWTIVRARPELAYELLPDLMLERAASAKARIDRGLTYYEAAPEDRPATAAAIIGNNVRVAFACFAGGIFLGVGSLFLLATNGATLGISAAHFANLGVLGYLMAFIVGHGVLELFAIAVAGAAGFRLGYALVVPGDHTRGEALMLAGRAAIPMVGATVVLLVVAGMIEGLASASDAGMTERLVISALSAVFLLLYLTNGWRHRRDAPDA
ncbi:MAG TPA: stage II sporulation protein M [Gemmatimonadales bacterium]|nr:stage II sporulation protein M [Gemmatimonadales bacterium]